MADEEIFSYVEPDLLPVLEEFRRREPIFRKAGFRLASLNDDVFRAGCMTGYPEAILRSA